MIVAANPAPPHGNSVSQALHLSAAHIAVLGIVRDE